MAPLGAFQSDPLANDFSQATGARAGEVRIGQDQLQLHPAFSALAHWQWLQSTAVKLGPGDVGRIACAQAESR